MIQGSRAIAACEKRFAGRRRQIKRLSVGLGFLCGALCTRPAPLAAQPERPAVPSPTEDRRPRPPSVLYLPALRLRPPLTAAPEDLIAKVLIDVDGTATLIESSAQGALRGQLEAALAAGRFAPAQADGRERAATVQLRFTLDAEPERAAAAAVASARTLPQPNYGAVARVETAPTTARTFTLAEMREVPGTLGDPFRILDTLPGVTPLLSGLPYVYVRGASPSGTAYIYDGVPLPSLFHLGLGPAVIHPRMLGDLHFYPAAPPARYGRFTGGVYAAAGARVDADAPVTGELELRLLDLGGMLNLPVGDGRLTLAGRYGYPGLVLSLLSEVTLSYWDYQGRLDYPIDERLSLEVAWLGAYDSLGEENSDALLQLEFHRIETRFVFRRPGLTLGAALLAGYESSTLDDDLALYAYRLGPRLFSSLRLGRQATLRLGIDAQTLQGDLDSAPPDQGAPGGMGGALSSEISLSPALTYGAVNAAVNQRQFLGAYGEFELQLPHGIELSPGLRADTWISDGNVLLSADPRLALRAVVGQLTVHTAAGLAHQLAVLPLTVPGFSDLGLSQDLQTAYQSEVGVSYDQPGLFEAKLTGFYNHLTGLLLLERTLNCSTVPSEEDLCKLDDSSFARGAVDAYGLELFIRKPMDSRISGWVSYTLSWADGWQNEARFTPEFDVRHLFNAVLQWRIWSGLRVSSRLHYRSGRYLTSIPTAERGSQFAGQATSFNAAQLFGPVGQRLPDFFRADAGVSYRWSPRWGRMQVSLEWLNVTLSREAREATCRLVNGSIQCQPRYLNALFLPNFGVRAEF